jgi:serine protease
VQFKDPQSRRSLSTSSSHDIIRVFKHGNSLKIRLDAAEVQELMDSDDVLNVEEDQPVHLSPTHPSSHGEIDASIGENPAEVPYGIQMVQALDVPDDKVGSSGMTVSIADTGYDILQNDLPQGSKVVGKSFITGQSWNVDSHGYGTHVAGTIAALEDGLGVVGVVRNGEMNLVM